VKPKAGDISRAWSRRPLRAHAARVIYPTADEAIQELIRRVEEKYFRNLDPRFVRSYLGEATPEEEHQVREELERGYCGGINSVSVPGSV
jgi:hypothetical protein